jgi:hypothetical protein
MNYSK